MKQARLYFVLVGVRYTLRGFDDAVRWVPVQIVAFDTAMAETGAMAYAELLPLPAGFNASAHPFAFEASTYNDIAKVDCIAESVIR
jgi:hypothetical protein